MHAPPFFLARDRAADDRRQPNPASSLLSTFASEAQCDARGASTHVIVNGRTVFTAPTCDLPACDRSRYVQRVRRTPTTFRRSKPLLKDASDKRAIPVPPDAESRSQLVSHSTTRSCGGNLRFGEIQMSRRVLPCGNAIRAVCRRTLARCFGNTDCGRRSEASLAGALRRQTPASLRLKWGE